MMRFAVPRPFPFAATLCTLLGVVVLCWLGHWQQDRLVWKNDLQASLDREFAQDATAIDLKSEDLTSLGETGLKRGTLTGRFDFSRQILLGGQMVGGKGAYYVIVPFIVEAGSVPRTVFVVAGSERAATPMPAPATHQAVGSVTGAARLPSWNRFTPANEPGKDLWYRADVTEMAADKNLPAPFPALLYLEQSTYDFGSVKPVEVPRQLRNDHRQYMLFWYTMAVILVVIYGIRFWRSPKPD